MGFHMGFGSPISPWYLSMSRILLPRPLVDAISGAVGEFGQVRALHLMCHAQRSHACSCHACMPYTFAPLCLQILLLYPVETIKVRCQTDGMSAAQVVAQMGRQAAQPGGAQLVLKQLYSGIGATAVFSIAVGAIHCELLQAWGLVMTSHKGGAVG